MSQQFFSVKSLPTRLRVAKFQKRASDLQTHRHKTEFTAKWPFNVNSFGVTGKETRE